MYNSEYGCIWCLYFPTEAAVLVDNMEDTDPNDNLNEPIYANVNSKKQSQPIKVEDLYEYIRTNKKDECDGFKKEFNVSV